MCASSHFFSVMPVLVAAEIRPGALIPPFGPVLEGLRYDLVYPSGTESRPPVAVLRSWAIAGVAPHIATGGAPLGEALQAVDDDTAVFPFGNFNGIVDDAHSRVKQAAGAVGEARDPHIDV
mgnify:CR=1 FL=1